MYSSVQVDLITRSFGVKLFGHFLRDDLDFEKNTCFSTYKNSASGKGAEQSFISASQNASEATVEYVSLRGNHANAQQAISRTATKKLEGNCNLLRTI